MAKAKAQSNPQSTSQGFSTKELDQREDYIKVVDENPDELELKKFSQLLPNLDFSKVKFIHSQVADQMIKQAQNMIEYMLSKLGPNQHEPRIPDLLKMFESTYKIEDKNATRQRNRDLKDYIPTLKELEQHTTTSMDDLLKAKYDFERNSHKNKTAFMLSSINVGAGIATATVNWDFAVQTYKEARENAEATYKEAIYKAYINELNQTETRSSNLANEILNHQASFQFATDVAKAMDAYGKEISKANTTLGTAYAALTNELVKQWNAMTQGETTLILANRTDSYNLWTAIRNAYNKIFSGNRKI